ncbi:MAG: response regulator transcription factor [Verrucomicrobia bacterium]|jgi:DNA-binding NarL/FixJ family response regulator|nr:response regulator transcription factor [Verrucomicrobiota bacterium]
MVKPIQVALVEDDRRLRESLAILLGGAPGLRLVGAFADAEQALATLPGLRPNVVLLDINLPGLSGVEAVDRLRILLPDTAVLMLTVYEDADQIFRALRNGARGYLLKRTAPARLLEAITEAHEGGAPMSPQIARKVVQHFHQLGPVVAEVDRLTPREREVLDELAKGSLYKEIASRLGIGVETVRTYLASIYRKLHVQNRTEAVVKYLGRA